MNTEASLNLEQQAGGTESAASTPLHQQPGLRGRVLQNTAANIAGRGLAIFFSAGASVLLARFLGAEKLGQYGAVYAYLALFGWLATFGFEPVLVREISRERGSASSLLRTAMVLSLFLSFGTVALAVVLAPLAGYTGYLRTLLLLAGLEYVLTPIRLPALIFQVDMKQWYSATINVVRQGLWFAMIAVLWVYGAPLAYVVGGRVLAAAFESWLMWRCSRPFLAERGKFLKNRAGTIFSHSFPIAFTTLLAMIYMRIDQVMLHKMVSDSVLGQYVAAVKVSELFEMLPSALLITIAPVLAVSVDDTQRFRGYTDRVFRYFMLAACALSILMSIGAGLIVQTLYGRQFAPAAPLLAVLIWSEIPVFFATVVANVLVAEKKQNLLPIPTLAGAAANIGINLVLIPRYGALGASWATLVSYTFAWMVCLLFFKRTRALTLQGLRYALPAAGLALASALIALFVFSSAITRICVAISVFLLGSLFARLIYKSDLKYATLGFKDSFVRIAGRGVSG